MTEFDKTKDKQLAKETIVTEKGQIEVSIMQYNEGIKKLQLSRMVKNTETEDLLYAKLGRMTKEEVEKVYVVMQKLIKEM